MHDDLSSAPQRVVADGVHVADDDVGLQPELTQSIGAAVDTDEHRPVLADVRPQRAEVLSVVITTYDDKGVPTVELRVDVGNADPVQQQLALAPQVLHGVGGEGLELQRQSSPRLGHRGCE